MKNKDLDFIKDKFENSGVNAPESIGKDFVMGKINEIENTKVSKDNADTKVVSIDSKKKKSKYRFVSAMAACLAVAVMATAIIPSLISGSTIKGSALVSSRSGKNVLRNFRNYDEVKTAVKDAMKNTLSQEYYYGDDVYLKTTGETELLASSYSTTDIANPYSYSNTYVQVEGVQEGARVKTNGKYIFSAGYDEEIDIYKVAGKDTKRTKVLKLSDYNSDISSNDYLAIDDLYLIDDKLIVIYEKDVESKKDLGEKNSEWVYSTDTFAEVYDVSDIENIEAVSSFTQSGGYCSSRLIDNQLYLVSESSQYVERVIDIPYTKNGKKVTCGTGEDSRCFSYDNSKKEIAPENIYTIDNPSDSSFSVISRVNVQNMDNDNETKAVLGVADDIYCNLDNLYIAGNVYVNDNPASGDEATEDQLMDNINSNTVGRAESFSWSVNNPDTQIVKINIEKGLDIVATATVKGAINDQYSFDEYKGNLRVATTVFDKKDTNYMYVLDSNLGELGTVESFAKGESIRAVNYVNDYAYVITYRETDPLFVMDLSNPQKPKIMGSVKIDGFSSMLVPIDDNTLLGIGYHTSINEDVGEFTDGTKLVLFDVSDKTKPKVLDTKVFKNSSSTVQSNPRALVVNKQRGNYTIPITYEKEYKYYDKDYKEWFEDWKCSGGQVTFSIKNNKLVVENRYKTEKFEYAEYCLFVDDNVYIIGDEPGQIDCVAYNN